MTHTGCRRLAAVMLALLTVMALTFTGCGRVDNTEGETGIPSFSPDEAGLYKLLDAVQGIPVATMGSSVYATDVALQTMEWCRETTMTSFEISDIVTARLATLEGEAWETFATQLDMVGGYCYALYDEESRASTLLSIGIENTDFGWTEDTLDKAVSLTSY